ncbi:MAG TPA: hypothetical protein DEQ38_14770 [Elusimicrobia bacterium]|nr:MAG: hypothetical protein A2089_02930 [Elusimicrobia bacterium GWD2_63_28]HCC49356.1 hypothetical protein [Elusimicrobiota bacterium]
MKKYAVSILLAALALLPAVSPAKSPIGGLNPRLGGPGTTTPQYIRDLEDASAALRKLDKDSRELYAHQDNLITRVRNIEEFLDTSASRLGLLSTIDADLKKLEASLRAADSAAAAAEAVPQAREKAKKVRAGVAASLENVTAARKRMDAIVAKTEPIRIKLAAAADKAGKLRLALYAVNSGAIGNMRFPIAIASGCLKKMPADRRACAYPKVDDAAGKADAVVLEYDRVVRALLYKPEPWLPSMHFFDPFGAELGDLDALRLEIEKLMRETAKLTDKLGALARVLDASFSFSFPYPNPTLDNPLRTSDYEVSIGFKTIIDSANAIESAIEKKISGFLWGVLKELGVAKYVRELEAKARSAVNKLMEAVPFDLNVELPSLAPIDAFEASIADLLARVDGLSLPEIDVKLPGYGFPGVNAGVNFVEIDAAFKFISPNGFDVMNPRACDGVSYGCN